MCVTVSVNMEKILEENHNFDHLIKNYLAGRDAHVRKVAETYVFTWK